MMKLIFRGFILWGMFYLGTHKEIGRMTFWKFYKLYTRYKNHYDFTLSKKTYSELDYMSDHDGEFLPD